jgi:hypothetical protein
MSTEINIAIISASSAITGAIISQTTAFLIAHLERKRQRNILLRQKYEEMMNHIQDSLLFYNDVGACKTLDQLLACTHSQAGNRAMGLALLYFPSFVAILEAYLMSLVQYYNVVVSSFNPNIPATAGAQALVHDHDNVSEIQRNLFELKNKLINELQTNVRKYVKS